MAKKEIAKVDKNVVTNEMDVFTPDMVKEFSNRAKAIKVEMKRVDSSFIKIAFNLHWIYTSKTFKSFGYDDIYTFARSEFNIARGTCNNFINVVQRFGKRGDDGRVMDILDDAYKGFGPSQLIVMLGLEPAQIAETKPDMSVREIKRAVKAAKEKGQKSGESNREPDGKKSKVQVKSGESGKSDGQEKPVIDVKSVQVNRKVMMTFDTLTDYVNHVDACDEQIQRLLKRNDGKSEKHYRIEITYVC